MRPGRRLLLLLAVLAIGGGLLAGCGSSPGKHAPQRASLVLDFTPNAVHAGIYSALAHHYDERAGVSLHVIAPSASTDSVKLLEGGRVDFAILDIHDLAIARERGRPIVGIMAIVERPLAAVIAEPQVHSPRQLQGRLVGVTGLPSDTAVLDSVVSGAGGRPARVRTITIGFNAVPALLAGRVAAATAFWNDEGVALTRARPGFHVFRVDSFGAPAYPELVLCATETTLRHRPGLARGVVSALVQGYRFTVAHPRTSASELESAVSGLQPALVKADLDVLLPAFTAADGSVGELGGQVLRRWSRWEARFGVVRGPPAVGHTFDPRFLPRSS